MVVAVSLGYTGGLQAKGFLDDLRDSTNNNVDENEKKSTEVEKDEEEERFDSTQEKINFLLEEPRGLNKNGDQIKNLAGKLSDKRRRDLYRHNTMEPWLPFAVNFFLGFGVGSFIQGDMTGGLTGLIGEGVSLGIVIGGYSTLINATILGSQSKATTGIGLIVGGSIGLVVFAVYQWIRPFSFANKYNERLKRSLLLSSMEFSPYLYLAEDKTPVYGGFLSMRF